MADKKAFFKLTDMAETWEAFRRSFETDVIAKSHMDERTKVHFNLIVWQIEAQLAIAQQLSIVSKHLGEICERAKPETS